MSHIRFILSLVLLALLQPCVGAGKPVISEIMYHPIDGVSPVDGDEYEFLELHNPGLTVCDLTGAYFSNGIDYRFTNSVLLAPGEYLVLVKNRLAFTSRYPGVTNLAEGVFSGNLSNSGEKITLKNALAVTLVSVDYDDQNGWPEEADGEGSSLLNIHPAGDPDNPLNWCSDARLNGSPGQGGECISAAVVINEVFAHTDLPDEDSIELLNVSTVAIDISGWFLSDDVQVREKYRIPLSSPLPAGGYAVFTEAQFNDPEDPNTLIPFALSELGDDVYLTKGGTVSNAAQYVDGVTFGASENGVTIGRFPNGTGPLVFMDSPTLGGPNASPKVGPLAISEIMYHPEGNDSQKEYIEILNVHTSTVPLYDPLNPTNTWVLSGGVTFRFPTGMTLVTNERILVTPAADLSQFRSVYGISSNVAVFGPWAGKLNNTGDDVRLLKPGAPETNLTPYILVDRVEYDHVLPWPVTPDGKGPSLERANPNRFGNSPMNWFAGPPGGTPGRAPSGGLYDVRISPVSPAPSQTFTATVSFAGMSAPSQVMFQSGIDGVNTSSIMTDDGVQGDEVAGDGVYSLILTAPETDSWYHYQVRAEGTNGQSFTWPGEITEYRQSPSLTVRMSFGGFLTTVTPSKSWNSYEVPGTFTDLRKLYVYLNGDGEAWVDDVSIMDDSGAVEHIQNGGFEQPVGSFAWSVTGSHSRSSAEAPAIENGNHVLHIRSSGPGGGSSDSATCLLAPGTEVGETGVLRFRVRQASTAREGWSWFPVGTPPPSPVVINEIMYHAYPSNDVPYEYIELHNASSQAVDISNWEIRGVGLTLPAAPPLDPGAYRVYAADAATMVSAYGLSDAVGDWPGQLENNGESLRLVNTYGRVVEQVDYEHRPPWPLAADGYGPSLERVHPALPPDSDLSWRASLSSTNWEYAVWTGAIASANSGIHLYFPDSDGKCYIDNVSVVQIGGSSELVSNGDFESGSDGWSLIGNHRFSRAEPGMGLSNSTALALVGNTSRVINDPPIIFNGRKGSDNAASFPVSTVDDGTYKISFWYRSAGRGQRLVVEAGNFSNSLQLVNQGTPGRINSVAGWREAFRVTSLGADSNLNPTGQPITVRASINDPSLASDVRLYYRLVTHQDYEYSDGHYLSLSLADDGVPPDVVAGDGSYAGHIPAVYTNNTLIRYHVLATSIQGSTERFPHGDDPSVDEGCWVQSVCRQTNLPNWNILMDGGPDLQDIILKACVVSPDGQIFTDIDLRHRGRYSRYDRSGFALRMHRGRPLDAWFAPAQTGINFRGRNMSEPKFLRRIVNEYLSYSFYQRMGLPTPRFRHVCNWINGTPFITMSLEHPKDNYLKTYDLSDQDLVSRYGYTGLQVLGGTLSLNNLDEVLAVLEAGQGSGKSEAVRRHVAYEQVRHMLASLAVIMNGDQDFTWNTIEHRRVRDGRWYQYPWDADDAFRTNYFNHHPYIETPEFPGIYGTPGDPLHDVLFSPISGSNSHYTLPYRFRHQKSIWRLCHTLFTTNVIYPMIDHISSLVGPAFQQIGASSIEMDNFETHLQAARDFVPARRNFLLGGSWGDAIPAIWSSPTPYDPSTVVLTEFMPDPAGGGEYLEFYNTGGQTIDLSQWVLSIGDERYRIPFGTMIAPTSYLVIADTQLDLTNYFHNTLGASDRLVQRYWSLPIWDEIQVWTNASEFSTRILEIPQITLPNDGAVIRLMDLLSNSVDLVSYTNSPDWNLLTGYAQELADPLVDNSLPGRWRPSIILGTPGLPNAATQDLDFDQLPDAWEQQIVDASGGHLKSADEVLPEDDFDMDSLPNRWEFIHGFNPTVADADQSWIQITRTNDTLRVEFPTRAITGAGYELYRNRLYTLESILNLETSSIWRALSDCQNLSGNGSVIVYTNYLPDVSGYYRYSATLEADIP